MHESSKFQENVGKALERQVAVDAGSWPVGKIVALTVTILAVVVFSINLTGNGFELSDGRFFSPMMGFIPIFAASMLGVWEWRNRRRPYLRISVPMLLGIGGVILGFLLGGHIHLENFAIGLLLGCSVSALIMQLMLGRSTAVPRPVLRPVALLKEVFVGAGFLAALIVAFYTVEKLRGNREWNRVKSELSAIGESLDFETFLTPQVKDEVNVMAHPFMRKAMIRGSGESPQLNHMTIPGIEGPPFSLANLKTLPRAQLTMPLRSVIGVVSEGVSVPEFRFTNAVLAEVVKALAHRAGFKVADHDLSTAWFEQRRVDSTRAMQPSPLFPRRVNLTFTNVTAVEALAKVTSQFGLVANPVKWREDRVLVFDLAYPSLLQVEAWYEQFAVEFRQLEEALERPHSQLRPRLDDLIQSQVPNYVGFRMFAQAYASRCKTQLLLGQSDKALHSLKMVKLLGRAVCAISPPSLVEGMMRGAICRLFTETLEETLADSLWQGEQLDELQKLCEGWDLLSKVRVGLQGGERAGLLFTCQKRAEANDGSIFEVFRLSSIVQHGSKIQEEPRSERAKRQFLAWIVPKGWYAQNFALYARWMQRLISPLAVDGKYFDFQEMARITDEFIRGMEGVPILKPYRILTEKGILNFIKAHSTAANNQTRLSLGATACALEHYRKKLGSYPKELMELVPEFMAAVPEEVVVRDALKYRRLESGKYLLYSVGGNLRDDGGELGSPDAVFSSSPTLSKGDLVWGVIGK